MIILHVTDFRFNKRWFDWLLHRAPEHDLTVLSGDLLDRASETPQREQIAWVSAWLSEYPRPICVVSGDHDLEWNDKLERWLPAYWLRYIGNPHMWVDGQRVELNGASIFNIGRAVWPKGGDADIWVAHAGPRQSFVATRANGDDEGDPDVNAFLARHAPRLLLSGHVHDPLHWRQRHGATLLLNPGCSPHAEIPNHIVVETDDLTCRRYVGAPEASHQAEISGPATHDTDGVTATAVG